MQLLMVAFLPHHDQPIFRSVIQLMPAELPPAFRFLQPFVRSEAIGKSKSLIHGAFHHKEFISLLSFHTFHSCRLGYHYPLLLSLWASILSEGITQACRTHHKIPSGNRAVAHGDALSFFLPILNEALSFKNIPQVQVSTYTALCILASSTQLDEEVIATIMEAIVMVQDDMSLACLMSLGVLAKQLQTSNLPQPVVVGLLASPRLLPLLSTADEKFDLDKLVLGLLSAILRDLPLADSNSGIDHLKRLLEVRRLSKASLSTISKLLNDTADMYQDSSSGYLDLKQCLKQMSRSLESDAPSPRSKESTLASIQQTKRDVSEKKMLLNSDMNSEDPTLYDFQALAAKIPSRTAYETSFLSHSKSFVFGSLQDLFVKICHSKADRYQFSELPVLRKSLGMREPLFVSFFVKVWCGPNPIATRTTAIEEVAAYLLDHNSADPQFLLPYILFTLADPSRQIRSAGGRLAHSFSSCYNAGTSCSDGDGKPILGDEQIYGRGLASRDITWLSPPILQKFLDVIILPNIEEFIVDDRHLSQSVMAGLKGENVKEGNHTTKQVLKGAVRQALFSSLCSHVCMTPLYTVKLRVLRTLNNIGKVRGTSRTALLLPLIDSVLEKTGPDLKDCCTRGGVNQTELLDAVFGAISCQNKLGSNRLVAVVKSLAVGPQHSVLLEAALRRIREIFPQLPLDCQTHLVQALIEIAGIQEAAKQHHAREILSQLPLSADAIATLLKDLRPPHDLPIYLKDSGSKRRSVDMNDSANVGISQDDLDKRLRQSSILLELSEDFEPGQKTRFLHGLWALFASYAGYRGISRGVTFVLKDILNQLVSILHSNTTLHPMSEMPDFRSDLVVDFVLKTPDIHAGHQGILLLSAVARTSPDRVLHSIMPIFTTFNTKLWHQDNEFAAYVVHQTLDSLLPPLVQSLGKRTQDHTRGLSELMLSFAAAFEHMSSRWRLDIYLALIKKLGADSYLHYLIALLLDKQIKSQSALMFGMHLIDCFDIKTQWVVITKYLDLLMPKTKSDSSILEFSLKRDNATFTNLLPFPASLLFSKSFRERTRATLARTTDESRTLRQAYRECLQKVFELKRRTQEAKYESYVAISDFANALLNILSEDDLSCTIKDLLSTPKPGLWSETLTTMEQRLITWTEGMQTDVDCLHLLPILLNMIDNTLEIEIHCVALQNIALIIGSFGRKDANAVLGTISTLLDRHTLEIEAVDIRIACLRCLSKSVETVGEALVPIMPQALSSVLQLLEVRIAKGKGSAELCQSAFDFVASTLSHVPWIVSESNIDRILLALYQSTEVTTSSIDSEACQKVFSLLVDNVDTQTYLRALSSSWQNALLKGILAIESFLRSLNLAWQKLSVSTIATSLPVVGDILVRMLGWRRTLYKIVEHTDFSDDQIILLGDKIIGSTIGLTRKLKDATFRPLFLRLKSEAFNYIAGDDENCGILHRTTFYEFVREFLGAFKVSRRSHFGTTMLT